MAEGGRGPASSNDEGEPNEDSEHDVSIEAADSGGELVQSEPEVVEGTLLEPNALRQVRRVIRAEIRRHSGPIPDPETLAGYETVQAGFAERIMAMAEREQQHRHDMDDLEASQSYRLASRGQAFALVALAIMASLAITLAVMGEPAWAAVVGGIDVAAVVGVFITGRRGSTEEPGNGEAPADRSALPAAEQEGDGGESPAS